MRLFHGTNIDFKEIDFQKCKPNKDFGKGFYLTDIKQQALDMAVRRTKFSSCGSPIVQEYEFDESLLSSKELKVKVFEGSAMNGHNSSLATEKQGAKGYITTILLLAP